MASGFVDLRLQPTSGHTCMATADDPLAPSPEQVTATPPPPAQAPADAPIPLPAPPSAPSEDGQDRGRLLGRLDRALAGAVLLFAFLVASMPVFNSDFFLH